MDLIQKYDLTQAVIKSLNRCRGKLEAIFPSDIMTADEQYIEPSAMCFEQGTTRRSRFKFPGRRTHKIGLGNMGTILAGPHRTRIQTSHTSRKLDATITPMLALVL